MPISLRAPIRLTASPSFYLVHHSVVLASLFDTPSHSLQDCTGREVLPTSETMAETTPLLPRANRLPHGVSIFLCVCHSPWPFISQRAIIAVRAIIASFLTVLFTLDILYGINYNQRGKQSAFEACNVSLVIQMLYYWMTTVGFSPLHCINPLISVIVLVPATYLSALWSIASRRTSQGEIPCPDTSRSLAPNVE